MRRFVPVIALLVLESGSAWSSPPPTFDAPATCRRGQSLLDGAKTHYQGCVRDETDAQKEMIKSWSTFRPGAQAMCAQETKIGGAPSYVELLTCLQLDQQGAAASLENKKPLTLQQFNPARNAAATRQK
jgi:hypothetical protein